ncbi:jg12727 [Pararge aegeria aegeria]|uniref:Jg12727 protein n=1 Tax=Pararge aegeria aegeria TaxID=348720 RepID=A0A8S4RYG1_9NEOP|nr:jg12727 [Pararge aegeria aegeria]
MPGGRSAGAAMNTGRCGHYDEGGERARARCGARAGGLALVHRELDALLRHILSDLRRVQHERYSREKLLQSTGVVGCSVFQIAAQNLHVPILDTL